MLLKHSCWRLLQKRCSRFCLVLLVGCSAFANAAQPPCLVRLWPGLTSLPAADRRASLPPIALADVEATGLSESSTAVLYRLNYADAQQLRPYTLARWTQPPVQLVQQALRASWACAAPCCKTPMPPPRRATPPAAATAGRAAH